MIMRHNSLDSFFRSPFGSLPCGAQARLRVTISGEAPDKLEMRAWNSGEHRFPMRTLGVRDGVLVYEAEITVPQEPGPFWYRFEAVSDGVRTVLGAPNGGEGCGEGIVGSEDSFQISVYNPFFETPEWAREGVMYQIMVDRFFHGEGTDSLL